MISILTPSYNYRRFLPAAVDSVARAAEREDYEHIIVDGGSTDGTVEWLTEHGKGLVWRSEPDEGQSDALNKGLALASGDIIGWLNADDLYLPGAIDRAAEIFRLNPDVDVVHGDTVYVDADGRIRFLVASYDVPAAILRWRGCVISSTTAFFRREVLEEDPWDPQLRTIMDWDLYLRLIDRGARFHALKEPQAAFRLHADQVTHDLNSRKTAEHRIVRERYGAAPGWSPAARKLGDLLHYGLKRVRGSHHRESTFRKLNGRSILDDNGYITNIPSELVRR